MRSLLGQALESETDDTIIDMEAGIEHLSRAGGTLANADVLILIMEPSRKAVITAQRTIGLAKELGVARWIGVGNKVDTDEARQAIEELCAEHEVPLDVIIPSTSDILAADRRGEPLDRATAPDVWAAIEKLVDALGVDAGLDALRAWEAEHGELTDKELAWADAALDTGSAATERF